MKTLINSLYLLSMYYMNSNNITMHKFGIENNYISMAMNTMLGKTNNTVKSMNVSETNAMVIDNTFYCILTILAFAGFIAAQFIPGVDVAVDATVAAVYAGYFLTSFLGGLAVIGVTHSCFNTNWD